MATTEKSAEQLQQEIDKPYRRKREITERLKDPRELRRGVSSMRNPTTSGARPSGPQRGFICRPDEPLSEDQPAPKRISFRVVKSNDDKTEEVSSEILKEDVMNAATEKRSGEHPADRLRQTDIKDDEFARNRPGVCAPVLANRRDYRRGFKVNNDDEEFRSEGTDDSVAKMKAVEDDMKEKQKSKDKPSFEYSGKLAAETNKVRGVTLQFTEPPEARKPTVRWRLYIFKDGEPLNEPLYIHRLSCYLFGRERRVADVPTDHPSCSKQHSVIQYRLVEVEGVDGPRKSEVRPYLMDLKSTNGTFLNGERIEAERYYELFEKDTIKFGNSSREYVLLHEQSAG